MGMLRICLVLISHLIPLCWENIFSLFQVCPLVFVKNYSRGQRIINLWATPYELLWICNLAFLGVILQINFVNHVLQIYPLLCYLFTCTITYWVRFVTISQWCVWTCLSLSDSFNSSLCNIGMLLGAYIFRIGSFCWIRVLVITKYTFCLL